MARIASTTTAGVPVNPTGGMTLDALMARQKELAARAGDIAAPRPMTSPWQGAAQMAQAFVNARQETTAADELTAGRQRFAEILAGSNPETGYTPQQISEMSLLDPDAAERAQASAAAMVQNRKNQEFTHGENEATRQATLDAERLKLDAAGQPKLSDIGAIRQDVLSDQAYKNMSNAMPIYNAMLETAGRDDLASDLNLVYGIAKIMDPNSVVKEGEQITVRNAQGLGDKLMGLIAQVNGKATLGTTVRQQLLTEGYGRMRAYADEYGRVKKHYTDIATRHGVDPRDVVDDFGEIKPYTPAPAPDPNNPVPPDPNAPVPPTGAGGTPLPGDVALIKPNQTYSFPGGVTGVWNGTGDPGDKTQWTFTTPPAGGG